MRELQQRKGRTAAQREKKNARVRERRRTDPIFREKQRAANRAYHHNKQCDPAFREKKRVYSRIHNRKRQADPAYRDKQRARRQKRLHQYYLDHPIEFIEQQLKLIERQKAIADPQYRIDKRRADQKRRLANPAVHERMLERQRLRWRTDPEYRERRNAKRRHALAQDRAIINAMRELGLFDPISSKP